MALVSNLVEQDFKSSLASPAPKLTFGKSGPLPGHDGSFRGLEEAHGPERQLRLTLQSVPTPGVTRTRSGGRVGGRGSGGTQAGHRMMECPSGLHRLKALILKNLVDSNHSSTRM